VKGNIQLSGPITQGRRYRAEAPSLRIGKAVSLKHRLKPTKEPSFVRMAGKHHRAVFCLRVDLDRGDRSGADHRFQGRRSDGQVRVTGNVWIKREFPFRNRHDPWTCERK